MSTFFCLIAVASSDRVLLFVFCVAIRPPRKLTNQRLVWNTCKQQWRPVEHVDDEKVEF